MANAADLDAIKKKGKQDKFNNNQELLDMRFILSTQQGRRFVWKNLTRAGIFQTSFTGNSTTFFNEGKRDIGLKMLADVMEASPDSYVAMIRESKQGENSNDGNS